jgi:PAS domain S-box-containing protein
MESEPPRGAGNGADPAEVRLRALADAMRAFAAATVDYAGLLTLIARRAADIVGDYASVILLTEDGAHTEPAAYYHPDPSVVAQIRKLLGDEPAPIAPITRRILDAPLVLSRIDTHALGPLLRPQQRDVAATLGVRGLLAVPLRAHGRPIGMLSLLRLRSDRASYDDSDLDLAQGLADHAALAISNARLLETSRRSEERYRRIVETTSDGIWLTSADARTTFMNAQMEAMLGLHSGEALGRPSSEFFATGDIASHATGASHARPGVVERKTLQLRRKDGGALWVSAQASPLYSMDGRLQGFLGVATDVTERRRNEILSARLAATAEVSHEAIVSTSFDGSVTSWSRGAERLFGYSADDVVGGPAARLELPERAGELAGMLERVRRGDIIRSAETACARKDGTRVEVSLTLYPIRNADGGSEASIIAQDLTEKRRAEAALRATEEQLRQAQKLEAVGSLAGGIAHDFNNLLSVILSFTSLVLDRLPPGDAQRSDLEEVRRAGERAAELTSKLLAFSRRQILQPRTIDLNQIATGMERMVRRLLGEDIELALVTAPRLGAIDADPGAVEQVLLNLLVNARDAMPDGGRVTVETGEFVVHEDRKRESLDLPAGPYVVLSVNDTGVGMDPATRARIFEPFFTTKERGKGTGLGLATVFGIVTQSGGHVRVVSEPGHGTRFSLFFPRSARAADALTAEAPPLSGAGDETILLVEDDDQVRAAARAILRESSYHILEAQNAGEAILISEQYRARIHLLLTDVVLPRMSGRQLAARLAETRPDMKVLYVSGYTETAIVHRGVLAPGIEFLQKPITPEALLRKIRLVLDDRT